MSESIRVEIIDSADRSVQCIHALQQVMDHFVGKLSAAGKDRKAVYAWYVERHNPNINLPAGPE